MKINWRSKTWSIFNENILSTFVSNLVQFQDPKADGEEKILKSYAELAEKLREEFRSLDD